MLEILALFYLSRKNKANALARGRKPGFFMAMTFVLWFVMEFLGLFIGTFLGGEIGAYLVALVFAAIGGLISYLMAKNCKPGDYMTPAARTTMDISQNAEQLDVPAAIRLVREKSFAGSAMQWAFYLNGQLVGTLANGQELMAYTQKKQNVLSAIDNYNNEAMPLTFDIQSGGSAVIYFKASCFMPAHSTGIYLLSTPARQTASPQATSPAADHCPQCGSLFATGDLYCERCGTRRYMPMTEG